MSKQNLCMKCGHDRAWHQYPMPQRDHIFTEPASAPAQETKQMSDAETVPAKKRKKALPCSVCGRRQHTGRWGPFDHEYQPMSESAAAARATTQVGQTAER